MRYDPIPDLKRELAAQIAPLVARGNADDLGAMIGADRARIYDLRHGKLERFSLETLIRFLARLHHRVEIHVEPPAYTRRKGPASRRIE